MKKQIFSKSILHNNEIKFSSRKIKRYYNYIFLSVDLICYYFFSVSSYDSMKCINRICINLYWKTEPLHKDAKL